MNRRIGVILSYVLMVFEVLSTLLLTPFIIRSLGQAEFGVYKLSAAITAYLLLLDMGVGNAIIRYIAKYRAEKDKVKERQFFGIATIFYAVIGILAFVIGCILVKKFPQLFAKGLGEKEIILGQKLLFITMLNASFSLTTSCYNNIILAYEQYKTSRICSIVQIIFRMIFTFTALKLGFGSVGIVVVNLIATVFVRIYMMGFVFFKIKLFPMLKDIDRAFIFEVVSYSSLIFLQMIATQINSNVDQILLGSLVSSSAIIIGVYGIGTQIVQYFQQIGSAFTSVLMPGIVNLVETSCDNKKIVDEMIKIGRMIMMVLALIWGCFLINGKNFISLWAGKENLSAYYVTISLMFVYIFILSESVGTQVLWALNEHKEQSYLKIMIVVLNIALTVVLIKWNPLIGATLGTVLSLFLGDIVVMNLIFVKKIKMNLGYYYRNLLKGIIPSLILTIISGCLIKGIFSNSWLGFIMKVIIMCVVYGACMLTFGMTQYEKGLVFSILKIKKKLRTK